MHVRLTGATAAALGVGTLLPGGAAAQTLDLSVTIPRLSVAEYHRPYVAMWLEKTGAAPSTLAVWYDYDMAANEGTKWLREVRQWWRVSGRSMTFPANGITGATRAPGAHKISFTRAQLGAMAAGDYVLVVEAAREVGGRELVRVPFVWPPKAATTTEAKGQHELGAVSLTAKP